MRSMLRVANSHDQGKEKYTNMLLPRKEDECVSLDECTVVDDEKQGKKK